MLLASAAALGVGLIAFPASAAAAPPVVPTCAFPDTAGSDSCGTLGDHGVAPPIGTAFENIKLGVRVRSQFTPATSETTSVNAAVRRRHPLNLAGVPGTCPPSELSGKNIAQAYEQCGPGADGIRPRGQRLPVAGGQRQRVGSTTVRGGPRRLHDDLQGADNNQVTIYARAPSGEPPTGCNNPATNTGGSATVAVHGHPDASPASSPYDWTLNVPNTHTANPALDDFYATVTRGTAFRAKCPAGHPPTRCRGPGITPLPAMRTTRTSRDGSVPVAELDS